MRHRLYIILVKGLNSESGVAKFGGLTNNRENTVYEIAACSQQ